MNKILIASLLTLIIGIIMFNIFSKPKSEMDLSAEEFKNKIEQQPGLVIDVRTQSEFDDEHLANNDGNYDLLNGTFESKLDSLDKDQTYYLYCRTGNRSGQAAKMMKDKGFENVFNIGGFSDLKNAGLETE